MEINKKTKFKKYNCYWIPAIIAAIVILPYLLLSYKPAYSTPPQLIETEQVSPYLTHVLLPQFYNSVQRTEPFDMIIADCGINDIIARSQWPNEIAGFSFMAPKVFFVPDNIILVGTINTEKLEFVITIIAKPYLDNEGRLNLNVEKVKAGAMNITYMAKTIARKLYLSATGEIDTNYLEGQIANSLLSGVPFEPLLEIDNKKARIEKIDLEGGLLKIRFIPILN